MPVLALFITGFSVAVASTWLRSHIFETGDQWLWIAFPLGVYSVLAAGMVFLLSRPKEPFRFSPLSLFIFLLVAIFIVFNAQVFLRPMFLTGTPFLATQGILAANLAFGKMVLSILALFIILTLLFVSTGGLTLRIARLSRTFSTAGPALSFTLRFIAGIGVWIAILILSHWIGLLGARPLLFIVTIILFAERRRLLEIGRWCLKKTGCSVLQNPFSILIGTLLLFLVAFNIAETVRPMPTGYDDMTHYMNRVTLMTERQSLLDGATRYSFELLAAGIGIATGESERQTFALSFGAYGLLIGTLFTLLLGREFFGTQTGLMAATIFLSVPMGPALAFFEAKPDSLLLPVIVALVWFLLEAWCSRQPTFFYFACFSFGLAVSIKLTAAIFIPGLAFGFFFLVWENRGSWFSIIRLALLGAVFFLLALSPWLMHDKLNAIRQSLHPRTETTLVEDMSTELWGSDQRCSFLGQTEDMLRFDPNPGWDLKEALTAPWHMTMNRYVGLFATEIGFLFLTLLPLGLLVFFRTPRNWLTRASRPVMLIVVTAIGAVVLWGVYAEHVAWYLYPALPLFSLLVAVVLEHQSDSRSLRFLLMALIVLGLVGNTLVRIKFGSSEPRLRYAAGVISAQEYAESVFPGYPISMQILNLYPEARILVTGSRHWYGIRDNDERAYLDTHLEAISCLLNRHGPDGTLTVLRQLDIRYVFFSKSLLSEYETTSRPTFTQKIRAFVEFSRTHLRVKWGSASHIIYELP